MPNLPRYQWLEVSILKSGPVVFPRHFEMLTRPIRFLSFRAGPVVTSFVHAHPWAVKTAGIYKKIKHSAITISQWNRNEGYLHVVGKFHENMPSDTQIHVRLNVEGSFFEPVPGEFGVKNNLFWALFDVGSADTTEGECIVRVIYGS